MLCQFLPPSFEAHLSGLPGFRAHVSYSVSAVVVKPNDVSNMVKSTLFRKDDWYVGTHIRVHCPFIHPLTQDRVYAVLLSPSHMPICANTCSSRDDRIERWVCGSTTMEVVFLDCGSQSTRDTRSGSQGSSISACFSRNRNTVTFSCISLQHGYFAFGSPFRFIYRSIPTPIPYAPFCHSLLYLVSLLRRDRPHGFNSCDRQRWMYGESWPTER